MGDEREWLRALTVHLDDRIETSLGIALGDLEGMNLDPRTRALVRLGALLALGASDVAYGAVVSDALNAGATEAELMSTLAAVAPTIGAARAVAGAPMLARAIGYDFDRDIDEY